MFERYIFDSDTGLAEETILHERSGACVAQPL